MTFTPSDKELETSSKWIQDHKNRCTSKDAAMGGKYSYCFTPTGVGEIFTVKCVCGEEVNATNFDSW